MHSAQWLYHKEEQVWAWVGIDRAYFIYLLPENRFRLLIDNELGTTLSIVEDKRDCLTPSLREPCSI